MPSGCARPGWTARPEYTWQRTIDTLVSSWRKALG